MEIDHVMSSSSPHEKFSFMLLERIGQLEDRLYEVKSLVEQSMIYFVHGHFYVCSQESDETDIITKD